MLKRNTKETIITLQKECLDEYIKDENLMYYRYYLNVKGLSTTNYANWCNKGIKEINDLKTILDDIQESRIWNELIKKNGKVNTVGAIFFQKTHCGYIEAEKLQNVKQPSTDYNININYETIPSRSEDDINKLIDDAKGE